MNRPVALLVVLLAAPAVVQPLRAAPGQAQAPQPAPAQQAVNKIDGDWLILLGPKENFFRGNLMEKVAGQITGVMGDETAEYPVKGTRTGADVKIMFTIYIGGSDVPLSITGKFEDDAIKGTAMLDKAEMIVSVTRTSRY